MFSYRHAFHAGNHADVLKHAILVQILDYFNQKDAPYWVIDTHAGAGLYALNGEWAGQSGEVTEGLDRVLGQPQPPLLVERYLRAVQDFNPDGMANLYPGSPCLALHAMRPQDRLRLFELHPTEGQVLEDTLRRQVKASPRQVAVARSDGFTGLNRLLPPPPRRGLIVIDPSYEDKHDYRSVMQALRSGLQRFAQGCFIVWYPLIQRVQAHEMVRSMEHLPGAPWLNASLTVHKPSADGLGMHGSGIFVVNPPWTLEAELRTALPWLKTALAQDDQARFNLSTSQDPRPTKFGPGSSTDRPGKPHPGSSRASGKGPQKRSPSRK
ncbi:23S rRNA (adenine(2030)-N(6))-methyltransferase RlmJ [Castellaniella sp.]|uniref:23S rRNA (adenine(2030)-N(6))-methyltransferase RlmJ n=1 Tax=Castellaniella sp. TaxID=1955812 RepID=UPI002AFDFF6B|nr:23S rRNA (adenine(2030)-N(6))-methyltransferase RlmJ [Castellaniella sp.]